MNSLAQYLLGWINLKPPSGIAANVGNAAVLDGLIIRVDLLLNFFVLLPHILCEIRQRQYFEQY